MRRAYKSPVVKLINYCYKEQVRADSINCNSTIWHVMEQMDGSDCKKWRQNTEVSTFSLVDPCLNESPWSPPTT